MSMQSLVLIQTLMSMIMLERYKVIPGKSLHHLDDLQHICLLTNVQRRPCNPLLNHSQATHNVKQNPLWKSLH